MKGDWRGRRGRFGIGQRVASAAAIAVLAVSPVIAAIADAQLEGVVLTVAEAVFGEVASAQDCTDRHGDARECTATERNADCLLAAEDAGIQCAEAVPWYLEWGCLAGLLVNVTACTVKFLGDIAIPIG